MSFRNKDKKKVRVKYFCDKNNTFPLIPIILCHNDRYFPTMALVDSGATTTLISKTIAEFLQVKPPNQIEKIGGAAGKFEAYSFNITRMIITKGNVALEEFQNQKIRVSLGDELPYILLGRDTIFQKYKIRFEENKKQLWLLK